MAKPDHYENTSVQSGKVRMALASLSWTGAFRAAGGVAVVALGLAAVGGADWAVAAARQTMQGRMAVYGQYTPRPSMVHVGFIQIAENTP